MEDRMQQQALFSQIPPFSDQESVSVLSDSLLANVAHAVWDNSKDGMALTDRRGILVAVNDAFCAIVGKDKSELKGFPFTVVWGDAHIDRLLTAYVKRFRADSLAALVERRLKLWSGKLVDLEVSGVFVESPSGERYLLTILRDVSVRKAGQRKLHESERKYHELFDHAVQPMFQSSVDGRIIAANRSFLNLFGFASFEDISEIPVETLYADPADRSRATEGLKSKGYCTNSELQLRKKDGSVMTVLEHARALRDASGEVVMYEGILEDITERKEMEARIERYVGQLSKSREMLVESNAQKDRIFSVLSHDLRSPFGSILGFCEILSEDSATLQEEEKQKYISYIREAATEQLALVNDLLDWSRLETGRIKLDIRDIRIDVVAQNVLNSLQGLTHGKDISLSSTLKPGLLIAGDERQTVQLFSNLVSNAMKFTPPGGSVTIHVARETESGVTIAVTDTGIGIPPEDFSKLFKMEERYTRPGLSGEQGTGFGLPLCKEIVTRMGGTLDVRSELGKGTTFLVTLPKAGIKKEGTPSEEYILVVDDREGDRAFNERILRKVMPDISLRFASNGKEAMEITRMVRPAMVLCDYAMPVMNGLEFIRALRNDPLLGEIPVAIVTGEDSEGHRGDLESAGAWRVFAKPLSQSDAGALLADVRFKGAKS